MSAKSCYRLEGKRKHWKLDQDSQNFSFYHKEKSGQILKQESHKVQEKKRNK